MLVEGWRRICLEMKPPRATTAHHLSACPSARAQDRSSQGGLVCRKTHQLGALTGRSCLSGARQRAASSAARPASEHHRLPVGAAEGTRAVGSPSFAYFSWRSKKSESPVGATTRLLSIDSSQALAQSITTSNCFSIHGYQFLSNKNLRAKN